MSHRFWDSQRPKRHTWLHSCRMNIHLLYHKPTYEDWDIHSVFSQPPLVIIHAGDSGFLIGYRLGTLNVYIESLWQSGVCWDIFLWTVINWVSILPTARRRQRRGYKLSPNCTVPLSLHFTQEAAVHWPDIIACSMIVMFLWLRRMHATSCRELGYVFQLPPRLRAAPPNCVA